MSAEKIGTVIAGKTRNSFDVKWNSSSGEVYVSWAGLTKAGKASSAGEAMRVAEAFLYNK